MDTLQSHAHTIISRTLEQVMPHTAVKHNLANKSFPGKVVVIAIGKAAFSMAKAASEILGNAITKGIVLTKYNHAKGEIPRFTLLEAGHPVADKNSISGTEKILSAVKDLTEKDTVIVLLSGGGSALFEKPLGTLTLSDLQDVTKQLLACGADIVEMNTIRKHLSAVKGGRFAQLCAPASVYTIALSDIPGNHPDAIASGPTCADFSTCAEALQIIKKYNLSLSPTLLDALQKETPKELANGEMTVIGSVSQLCHFAAVEAQKLGYTPFVLTSLLDCEAKEAGRFLGSIAKSLEKGEGLSPSPCAVICGGETVVHLTGKGGRNQELALAAAPYLDGNTHTILAAIGSDGTDGPTDAAGGIVDGKTMGKLRSAGISVSHVLAENDAYHALKAADALLFTGATGTNVNDLYFLLFRPI